jgi:Flp pilus assembly protein TadG
MRARRKRQGQALIEFAVVLPVIILSFYAIFDMSRMLFFQVSLDAGAHAAARLLSLNHPGTTRRDVYHQVLKHSPGVLIPNDAVTYRQITSPTGDTCVEVEIVSEYPLLSGFYFTGNYRVRLAAQARVPLNSAAYGGKVYLP